jgi:hypothetical protein
MSTTSVPRSDRASNMTGAAIVFLLIAIVLGMLAGADMYAIVAGVVMLALVAVAYFAGR